MLRSTPFAYFVCFALTFYSLHSFAQKAELELMAAPAIVSTRLADGNNANGKVKIAPLVGIGFRYHINNHWSAGVKLLYELKGKRTEGPLISHGPDPDYLLGFGPPTYRLDINVNYITLPVMMRYSFGKKVQCSFGAGGFISHLMKAEQHFVVQGNPSYESDYDVTNVYNKRDAGICMTIDVAIPISDKFRLTVSLNESIGLVDIDKSVNPTTGKQFEEDIMTNSLSLQLGISYLLGGKK